MASTGFTLLSSVYVEEISSQADLFVHDKTGARILSMRNSDENKVFGVTFRTPAHRFHRSGPHSGAFGPVRIAQVSGQGTLCGTFEGLPPDVSQRHDLSGQDLLSGGQPESERFL